MNIRINSDDFGYSKQINQATEEALKKGMIHSTSLLVNFEPGFSDATLRVNQNQDLYNKNVGIHLNLTEGIPITEPIKNDEFFCTGNAFHSKIRSKPIFFLNSRRKRIIVDELQAQIDKAKCHGIEISHLDSHHHVHTEWAIVWIIIRLAKKNGIQKVRISRNIGNYSLPKAIYKTVLNTLIKINKLNASDLFGSVEDFLSSKGKANNGHSVEIMVHVKFNEKKKLVDLDDLEIESKIIKVQKVNHEITLR